ncbi:MAG: hypothetical protein ACYSUY_07460 [Planctomycetota bacterium]|jgi:hypothetical protein
MAKKKKTKKAKKKVVKKAKPKGPGVIASILDIIQKQGPVTKDDILKRLTKKFPNRKPEHMQATVSCQVPGRLNREKNAKIKRDKDGQYYVSK